MKLPGNSISNFSTTYQNGKGKPKFNDNNAAAAAAAAAAADDDDDDDDDDDNNNNYSSNPHTYAKPLCKYTDAITAHPMQQCGRRISPSSSLGFSPLCLFVFCLFAYLLFLKSVLGIYVVVDGTTG